MLPLQQKQLQQLQALILLSWTSYMNSRALAISIHIIFFIRSLRVFQQVFFDPSLHLLLQTSSISSTRLIVMSISLLLTCLNHLNRISYILSSIGDILTVLHITFLLFCLFLYGCTFTVTSSLSYSYILHTVALNCPTF